MTMTTMQLDDACHTGFNKPEVLCTRMPSLEVAPTILAISSITATLIYDLDLEIDLNSIKQNQPVFQISNHLVQKLLSRDMDTHMNDRLLYLEHEGWSAKIVKLWCKILPGNNTAKHCSFNQRCKQDHFSKAVGQQDC